MCGTGKYVDQPVTFHSRIKSSGYGEKPLDAFAKKRKEEANKKAAAARSASAPRGGARVVASGHSSGSAQSSRPRPHAGIAGSVPLLPTGPRTRRYPTDCGVMTMHQPHNDFPPHVTGVSVTNSPIYNICFNEDASMLGIATADTAVLTARLPVGRSNGEGLLTVD